METLVRKVLGAIAGVAICIAVWTIQDRLTGGGGSESADSIPTEVWGGGGGTVAIDIEASEPAVVAVSFESDGPIDGVDHDYLETWQKVPAGSHTFEIDVPAGVSGFAEVRIDEPSVGATLKIVVRADGKVVGEDFQRLEKPLEDGYGFFAQLEVEDYARGTMAAGGFLD